MEFPDEISEAYVGRAFKEGPPKARYDALRRMMAKLSTDELRRTLIEALDDRDHRVRKLAVESLAKLEGNDIFEAMLDRIVGDDNVEIRKVAGTYLQKFIATAPRDLRPAILGRLLLTGDAALKAQLVTELFASGDHGELLLEILTFAKTVLGAQHATILDSMKPLGEGLVEHAIRLLEPRTPTCASRRCCSSSASEARRPAPRSCGSSATRLVGADHGLRHAGAAEGPSHASPARADARRPGLQVGRHRFHRVDRRRRRHRHARQAPRRPAERGAPRRDERARQIPNPRVDPYIEQLSKTDPWLDLRVRAIELFRERRGIVGGDEAAVRAPSSRGR